MIGASITKRRVRFAIIIAAPLLLVAAGLAGWLLLNPAPARISLPKQLIESTLFTLYGPDPLPKGYYAPKDTAVKQDEAVVFYITNGKNNIAFSQQARPKDFDFQIFYRRRLTDAKTLSGTPYESRLGKAEGNLLLSVIADDTWLLITSKNESDEPVLRDIAQHLKRL